MTTKVKQGKLVRLDVVRRDLRWIVRRSGGEVISADFWTQGEAIRCARAEAVHLVTEGARGVTARIHRADGRIRDEFTYPRGADPKRSKG